MKQVKQERTGWRDMNLSERHRLWGWDCPAVDLDFLFLEYDKGKAIAIVEYKHERAAPQTSGHPTYQAMIDLADRAGIPIFACRYKGDFSNFAIVSLNGHGRDFLPLRTDMTEPQWVSFLYRVRGREISAEKIESLLGTTL